MKRLLVCLILFTLLGAAQPIAANTIITDEIGQSDEIDQPAHPHQMPIIESAQFRRLWDPYEDYEYWQFEVAIVLNNGQSLSSTTITFQNIRLLPDNWGYWPQPSNRQMRRFIRYSLATLSCNDESRAAHIYDNPATHNPASPISIYDYAQHITAIRSERDWCQGDAPPTLPPQACPLSAPHVDDLDAYGETAFLVDIELDNATSHVLGFRFRNGRWEMPGLYSWGDVGDCQEQLDTFVDFTRETLADPNCDPATYGDGTLLPPPDWYIKALTQFCRNAATP